MAHRLVEEVNYNFIMRVVPPMVPFDMTMASVIVHALIGELFANELDQLVLLAVDKIFGPQQDFEGNDQFLAFMRKKENDNLIQIAQRWPITLNLHNRTSSGFCKTHTLPL